MNATQLDAINILTEAQKLLSQGFAKHWYAYDQKGRKLYPPNLDNATCWCSSGAIYAVSNSWAGLAVDALQTVCMHIPTANDDEDTTAEHMVLAMEFAKTLIEAGEFS